jgi:hypothetical protein
MRCSLLVVLLLTFAIGLSAPAASGKGKGNGQHHTAKPHAARPQRAHPRASNASRSHTPNAVHSSSKGPGTTSGHAATASPRQGGGAGFLTSPFLSPSVLLPFGSHPALQIHGAYAAHRHFYGNQNGYRRHSNRGSSYGSARMTRLARLVRDLNTLTVGYVAPPTDTTILRRDLNALTQGTLRPPSAQVSQLTRDLISQLPRRKVPLLNTEQLALDLEEVMNGSRLKLAQVNSAINSARSIFRSSGLSQPAIENLTKDMRSVGQWGLAGNQAGMLR